VKRVLQDLYEQIHSKNAAIDIADPLPSVWANDSVLTQILTNLLTNAMKFIAPGVPPRIRIWTEPAENPKSIGLTRPVERKMVRVFIRDNGIGIPSDVQGGLFQPFQRGTSEPRYQGTGMGLAIVQKGAERLGGKVGFDSPPGQGTTFWLELFSARPIELKSAHEPESPASRR
jgi:signal transduction histidine kinase